LGDSLAILRGEQPNRYFRLCEVMTGCHFSIRTRDERFVLAFDRPPQGISIASCGSLQDREGVLELSFEPTLIGDLVVGATNLNRALAEEQLVVVGALEKIAVAYEGLTAYLHGATRAPSSRELWRRFQREFLEPNS
jgi:hypothetical protein